jgi:hypothetical protein
VVDRRDGFRVFYRLAPAESETRKDLLQFLAAAFRRDGGFRRDLRRLKEAIKDGACRARARRALRRAGRPKPAGGPQARRKASSIPLVQLPGMMP